MAKSYKRRGSKKNRSIKRKQMGGNVAANASAVFDNTSSRLISMIGPDAATQLTHAPSGQFNLKGGKKKLKGGNVAGNAEPIAGAQSNYLLTQQGGKKKVTKGGFMGFLGEALVPFGLVGLSHYARTRKQRK
jgi:hypothetical protein